MSSVRIVEQTSTTIHLEVTTSKGAVEIVADFAWFPDVKRLVLDKAHIEGMGPGVLGRGGLSEVKRALANFGRQYGAEAVIFQGGRRTSGRRFGEVPVVITIPCF